MTWGHAIGLIALLTFGYAVSVLRAVSAASKTKADDRWAVRLGNLYVWVVTVGAAIARKMRR